MKNILTAAIDRYQWERKEFADKVGISVSHLSLIEHGKRTPSLKVAYRIAYVIGLPVDEVWPADEIWEE